MSNGGSMRDQRDVEDPAAPRYLAAYGRDVDQAEQLLAFEPETRRLTIAGGSRQEAGYREALDDVRALFRGTPEPLSQRRILEALKESSEHTRKAILGALKLGKKLGELDFERGEKRAKLWRLAC